MSLKKILCALLASVMLVSTLASCATNTESNEHESPSSTEVSSETEPDEEQLDVADADYKKDIVILTRDCDEWSSRDIYSAGSTGETINDAVYRRNELVRTKLGVNIKQMLAKDTEVSTKVQQICASGLQDFHAIAHGTMAATSMATSGYLRDLRSNTIDNLDFDKPWWDQNLTTELTIGDHLFFANGDITIMDDDATFCLMFNKTLAENNQIPNLYELVDNRQWTMDKMYEYVELASTEGTHNRKYGLAYTGDTPYAMYHGAGIVAVSRDEDGNHLYNLDVKRADGVSDKGRRIFNENNTVNLHTLASTGKTMLELGQEYFGGGKALFLGEVLQCVERMRGYDVNFGVLPYPLYDTNQTRYYHMMQPTGGVVCIPRSAALNGDTLSMVTATLECMAYYSQDTLTEQYYEINLTSKFINDPESKPMIALILSSRVYDLAYYFDLTPGSSITATMASSMTSSSVSIGSGSQSMKTLMDNRINKLISSMDKATDKNNE